MTAAQEGTGSVFQAPGASIYYEMHGSSSGVALVVVNGGPGFDHTYMRFPPAWDVLAKNRPVVFYDQRGTGRSGAVKPGQSCTFGDQISDLEALRAHLGFERVDLLGHSWGGFLAMAYAAQFPKRVAHLILLDSIPARWTDIHSLYDEVYPDINARRAELLAAARKGDNAASAEALRAYLSMLFYSPEKRDAFLAKFSPGSVSLEVSQTLPAEAMRVDLTSEIAKFQFPTLVANGRFDTDITPSVAVKLRQGIPHSQFHLFERSGHMPFYEEPEEFVRIVEAFLNGKPTS